MILSLKTYDNMQPDDIRRFYPSFIHVIPYEPLKTHFAILESPEEIHKGVISLISFQTEDLIAKCTGFVTNFQTLHSLQYKEGIYYVDEFFAGYLLHSCNPNAILDMQDFSLHALKQIKPFSLITIDYEMTEDRLYNQFQCTCGEENCRGWISGKKK